MDLKAVHVGCACGEICAHGGERKTYVRSGSFYDGKIFMSIPCSWEQ